MFGTFWQRLVVGREFPKDGFRKCFSYMVTHDAPLTVVMKKGPWSASHFSPKLAKRSSFPIVQPFADIIVHLEHTNGDERLCGCRKAKIPYSTLHPLWSQYHKTYWKAHRDCEDMFSALRLLLVKDDYAIFLCNADLILFPWLVLLQPHPTCGALLLLLLVLNAQQDSWQSFELELRM